MKAKTSGQKEVKSLPVIPSGAHIYFIWSASDSILFPFTQLQTELSFIDV